MPKGITVGVKIEGADKLLRELQARGVSVKKSVRAASRAGGEVIRKKADLLAPPTKRRKRLILKTSFPKREICEVTIQPGKKSWYLKFFETGATAHEIKGNPDLIFYVEGRRVVTPSVSHPGFAARPFLRPAFDSTQAQATDAVGEALKSAVELARALPDKPDEADV